jgi:hypothetical protein
MGNFSRQKTFDALKHYVGVRLQQGVPIVDADWNEMEDIRKYELQAFLKWFVGDGVPKGNNGFRIVSTAGSLVLAPKKMGESITINEDASTAADTLGFGPGDDSASGSRASLMGRKGLPSGLEDGMTLVIRVGRRPEETVIFRASDFEGYSIDAVPAEALAEIINEQTKRVTAYVDNTDFCIQGGNGTPNGAGRCLVEGWDVLNESDLHYTDQRLYNNDPLAEGWHVSPLPLLAEPDSNQGRSDLVYLDVWEREVDSGEDEKLKDKRIGIETCVRLKREWVVRVAQGLSDETGLPDFLQDNEIFREGHAYYPLARLTWTWEGGQLTREITDLRRTGLTVMSHHDIQQIVTDAYGLGYTLDHDGQPKLKVSLREAINALLRGELPGTPKTSFVTGAAYDYYPFAIEDNVGDIWVFWRSDRSGNPGDIWYRRYDRARGGWGGDTQLTTDAAWDTAPFAIEDSVRDIWVFWDSDRSGNFGVWFRRYDRACGGWGGETQLTTHARQDRPFAIEDSVGDIWVFWKTYIGGYDNHCCKRYDRARGDWGGETQLTADQDHGMDRDLFVIADSVGDIWVFWTRGGYPDIWYRHYDRARGDWEGKTSLTTDISLNQVPFAIEDNVGDIWVFWQSGRSGKFDIWYKRYDHARGDWGGDTQLTTDAAQDGQPFAIEDNVGDIWVFWVSDRSGNYNIWYKRYDRARGGWGGETQLTTDVGTDYIYMLSAIADSVGDIWVFWNSQIGSFVAICYKKLIPAI